MMNTKISQKKIKDFYIPVNMISISGHIYINHQKRTMTKLQKQYETKLHKNNTNTVPSMLGYITWLEDKITKDFKNEIHDLYKCRYEADKLVILIERLHKQMSTNLF